MLQMFVPFLSAVANRSLHVDGYSEVNDNESSGAAEAAAEDDATGDEDQLLTSPTDSNVDQILQNSTLQIMALPVRAPPVSGGRVSI